MGQEGAALVKRWFDEVWTQGREATIDELMDKTCMVHGLGDNMRGPEAFKIFHRAYRDAFPDVKITVEQTICEGEMVCARWSGVGTHRGDGLGFKATNKPVRFSGMTIARFQNGKLVEGWNVFDQLSMFQQLGIFTLPV
jgi:steroid delta-isomerase-like uncharacterized protein